MEKKEGKSLFKGYSLTKGIVIAAILGIICGLIFKDKMANLSFIGTLFLRLVQMPIVLLVMCAVLEAVGTLRPSELGRIGVKTVAWFVFSTILAAILGVLLAKVFVPGAGLDISGFDTSGVGTVEELPAVSGLSDQILGYFSTNMFQSMSSGSTIQCTVVAILFGIALSVYGSKHETNPVLNGVKAVNEIVMTYLNMVIKLLPLAIFTFVSKAVGVIGVKVLFTLAKLIGAAFAGMIIMSVVYGVFTAIYVGVNPIKMIPKLMRTIIVCITTSSSAVALPIKIEDGEQKLGVSPRINRFVEPMGVALNTDGGVLYLTLSALCVAQIFGISVPGPALFSLIMMAVMYSFISLAVPGGGLVIFEIMLASVGLPLEGMVIIAAADFFLGPIRTVNNSIDDMFVAMLVAKSENEFSKEIYNGTKEFDPDVFSYNPEYVASMKEQKQ